MSEFKWRILGGTIVFVLLATLFFTLAKLATPSGMTNLFYAGATLMLFFGGTNLWLEKGKTMPNSKFTDAVVCLWFAASSKFVQFMLMPAPLSQLEIVLSVTFWASLLLGAVLAVWGEWDRQFGIQ